MLNLSYRNILICLICFVPTFCLAQASYNGQVIDKATEDPITGVNVMLIKEKTGTQTNQRGYFELSSEKPLADDTLQFSFVGYKTFKLPVTQYHSQIIIPLEASNTQLNEVRIAKKKALKNIVLDKFGYYDLKNISSPSYSHYTELVVARVAFAKLFTAPSANSLLLKISLGRQDHPASPTYAVRNKFTTFLVHVMAQDSLTGAPGTVLFTKHVSLEDNSLWVDVDLTNDKVRIPYKNFFIAVEWIRKPYNEIITVNNAPTVARTTKRGFQILRDASEYRLYYQPFLIGYNSDDDAKQTTLYAKFQNTWQVYRPNQTKDVALSATIHY